MRRRVTIAAVMLLLTPTGVAVADERGPSVSRGGVGRYLDSGHRFWSTVPTWIRSLGLCVARHESIMAGHYNANNSRSAASGRYQMLQSTWDGNARWARLGGSFPARKFVGRPASDAPAWVQDLVFVHSIRHGGIKAWRGTGCGYGT